MRSSLTWAGIILAVITALAAGVWFATRPTKLRIVVGPAGTEDARLFTTAAQILRRERASIRLRIETTTGPAELAARIDEGQADLAVIRSDVALPKTAETVAILHRNAFLLIANGQAKIASAADLGGHTVGILRGVAANEKLLDAVLAQVEVQPASVARIPVEPPDAANAISSGRIDALLIVGPVTAAGVGEAVRAVISAPGIAPVFVPVTEAEAMAERLPAIEATTVVRGAFGGTPPRPVETLQTIAVTFRLVARTSLSDATVTEFTRLLFQMRTDLANTVPGADRIEAPETDKDARLPVHSGAADYFQDEELTFMDRYGDWFYVMAMIVGFAASGIAAIFGHLRGRSHEQAHRMELLLALMRAARKAANAQELDGLEEQVDEIFADTLSGAVHEQVDQRRLSALALALDQVRHVIAERRRSLARV